ncbi:MAG: MFS transporter [Pseudomonadota bacterium]
MSETATTRPSYDRRMVGWLSLAQLITWGSVFYTFALLLEPVERELGMSRAQSSLAFSLALFAEGLAAYPIGRWIDRGHERAVMTGSSLLVGACLIAHSFIDSVALFYVVWIALGIGLAGTLYSPVFAVVTRRFPHDFRRAIITLTFLGGLASTVFIPLSHFLIEAMGWRHALWVLAALHFLICAPLHATQLRGAPGKAVSSGAAASHPPSVYLRSAPFLLLGVFAVGMMGVTSALPPHMISLLRGTGLGEAWVVAIPASIGVLQVFGRLLLYFFEHHFDLHLANRVIPMLIPLGLGALMVGAGHPWAAVLFVVLYGLGNGMMTIVKGTAVAQYVNREHVASLNGALGVPIAMARALAPFLMGALWTAEAGYRWGLWLMLGVSFVSVLALVLAQKRSLVPA